MRGWVGMKETVEKTCKLELSEHVLMLMRRKDLCMSIETFQQKDYEKVKKFNSSLGGAPAWMSL